MQLTNIRSNDISNGQKYLLRVQSIFQDLLAEMDTHEEIIKLLSNITDHLNKVDNEDDSGDATSLMDDIKKIQTNLYKLWLRLLEWECLLEQQQLGHLQVMIMILP